MKDLHTQLKPSVHQYMCNYVRNTGKAQFSILASIDKYIAKVFLKKEIRCAVVVVIFAVTRVRKQGIWAWLPPS